jgi:hypothetical protein
VYVDPFDPRLPEAAADDVPAAAIASAILARPAPAPPAAPLAYHGPFDREAFPERITARVVEPGADARIHGYHVAGDLARHHGVADLLWLALRGDLPTEGQRAALEVACVLLAPVHLGQAPSHAAYVSRISGAPAGATLAIGAVGLGELVRQERETLAPWTAWLERGGAVPAVAIADGAGDEAIAAQRWLDSRVRAWFGPERALPAVPLTRVAQAYALLHHLGLRGPLALETIAVWARLPVVAAEASHARPGAIDAYPARLPDYQYVDAQGATP